jgi:Na+/H+ antiporter NhaD/arsenite permease-like protein
MTVLAVAIFVVAYALIAFERFHRSMVAIAGAGLLLLIKVVSAEEAFHSPELGIDWEVVFLLLGMMMIVAVLLRTGLFEYLAIWSAKRARGRPYRVMVILCLITAFASALLDNVTTVLLVAPVTILIAERLGVSAVPYLIAEVLASNIGGAATLVGDPPNIIIASAAGLSYVDFLAHLAPVILVIMAVFLAMAKVMFRNALQAKPDRVAEVMRLDEREAITDWGLLTRSLVVLFGVTIGFLLHSALGYEPVTVALIGAGAIVLVSREDTGALLRDVEWGTLVFFMGLFVMVGALVKVGVIEALATEALRLSQGSALVASLLILFVSGLFSGVVDNIPYVAAMAPLVAQLTADLPGRDNVLWWSLALGADLGGNATPIGAAANVVVIGLASRAGHQIRFGEFLKYGGLVTAVSISISALYVWLRYFLLGS